MHEFFLGVTHSVPNLLITTNILLGNIFIHPTLKTSSISTAQHTCPPEFKARCLLEHFSEPLGNSGWGITSRQLCTFKIHNFFSLQNVSSVEHIRVYLNRCAKFGGCTETVRPTHFAVGSHRYLPHKVSKESSANFENCYIGIQKLTFQKGLRKTDNFCGVLLKLLIGKLFYTKPSIKPLSLQRRSVTLQATSCQSISC